ncbi:putative pentapeptide [Rosa chinensis]|uniref:Putative pentapeptide n=1 Tax=Rosa chinensis TaxID=74649 RepID=A0A2P6RS75_ROSCH|nr:putative pentapeptide [Rosa chinensis]
MNDIRYPGADLSDADLRGTDLSLANVTKSIGLQFLVLNMCSVIRQFRRHLGGKFEQC